MSNNTNKKRLEEKNADLVRQLKEQQAALLEREKELACLHKLTNLAGDLTKTREEVLQGAVEIIPPAWQYPDITCARLSLDGQCFTTTGFAETAWRLKTDIRVASSEVGAIEVYYLEERPEAAEGPFIKEERELIDTIAEEVGQFIERSRANETQARLAQIIESIPDFVSYASPDGQILFMNRACRESLGIGPKESVSRVRIHDLHPAWACEVIMKEGIPAAEKRGAWYGETALLKGDGKEIPVRQVIVAHRSPAGKIAYLSTVMHDILEEKASEEALRRSEATYRSLVENLPQKVFLKDREGAYVSVNENYARDLGLTSEQMKGKNDYEFYSRELADKYRADDQRIIAAGATEELDETYVRQGEERVVHTVKTLIKNEAGKVTGVLGLFWDITERVRNDEELQRHREKLEELVCERTAELEKEIEEGKRREAVINDQALEILELSTPVIPVWEGIVISPIIGALDSRRAQGLMEELLERVADSQSRVVLMDVTGLAAIDTQVAQHLIDTISAVRLLGAQVVLTGMRPAIAQVLTHLGIDLSGVVTKSSLTAGLAVAMGLLGYEVRSKDAR